jgi:hypothetical protein
VKPRRPFRPGRLSSRDEPGNAGLSDIEDLSRAIAGIEHDGKGVPILLRHYLKLGGRLLGFNADNLFSDALDGLIMVDLRSSDPRTLARHMGEEGAAKFLDFHRVESGSYAHGIHARMALR